MARWSLFDPLGRPAPGPSHLEYRAHRDLGRPRQCRPDAWTSRTCLSELDLLGAPHRRRIRHPRHDRPNRAPASTTSFRPSASSSMPRCLVSRLRLIKSPAEIAHVEKAASLADDALDAALPLISPGGNEADILAAMQGAIFAGGGDYPANEFIIGSGADALLCRYKAGRRKLDSQRPADARMGGRQRPLSRRHDAHRRDRRADQPPPRALQRLPRNHPGDRDGAAPRQHLRRPSSTCMPRSWTSAALPGTG